MILPVTFKISAISSSDIVGKRLSGFLVHRFFFFGERKSWSSMTTTLWDVTLTRSDQTRRDDAVSRLRRARFSSTSSTPTGGPSTCMRSVILHNPSGYALGITQYYFAHIRGRHLVGMLLLLHSNVYCCPLDKGESVPTKPMVFVFLKSIYSWCSKSSDNYTDNNRNNSEEAVPMGNK